MRWFPSGKYLGKDQGLITAILVIPLVPLVVLASVVSLALGITGITSIMLTLVVALIPLVVMLTVVPFTLPLTIILLVPLPLFLFSPITLRLLTVVALFVPAIITLVIIATIILTITTGILIISIISLIPLALLLEGTLLARSVLIRRLILVRVRGLVVLVLLRSIRVLSLRPLVVTRVARLIVPLRGAVVLLLLIVIMPGIVVLLVTLRRRVVLSSLRLRSRLVPAAKLRARRRRANTDALVADIVGYRDLDLGEVFLYLLLHHALDNDPRLALKFAVPAVHYPQNTLAERLLHLFNQVTDLADELRFEIVADPAIRLRPRAGAVELRVKRVAAEQLLERALELVGKQLEQLLFDGAEDLAEFQADFPMNLGESRAELVADYFGKATVAIAVSLVSVSVPISDTPG